MSIRKAVVVATFATALALPAVATAHCDTMDGPVVKAAQRALATANLAPALIWVEPGAEAELRNAFTRTMEVRRLNGAARELADRYFFETLVRLHRAGEGEPFTGLKPAGSDVGPAIPAADRALESGSLDPLARQLSTDIDAQLRARFNAAVAARAQMRENDVESGRRYVKAYVALLAYVERLHEVTESGDVGADVPAPGRPPEEPALHERRQK